MSLVQFLFSFEGRVRRRDFWLFFIVIGLIYGRLLWIFGGDVYHMHGFGHGFGHPFGGMYGMHFVSHNWAISLLGPVALWAKLAVTAKRWHDRDKSAWWLLINLIPVIGWIWQVIEGGFLDGTPGSNRFGPSPKSVEGQINRVA